MVPLTEEERVAADIYMLRSYRCNSPPVNPYAEAEKEGDVALLHEVFEPGRWRIDSKRERRSVNHAKIMASLDADGASSPYVKARDPDTGEPMSAPLCACIDRGIFAGIPAPSTCKVGSSRS